jgi:glycosyltransferase involved in cell wall biosynthesis
MDIKYKPKVTIITSVLNDALNLKNAIQSIREQDYNNLEYIVIDGGSTDNTLKVIIENTDIITNWISEKDNGIYSAWNKGLKIATGDWICFLGADDILMPNVISILINKLLEENREIDYISGRTDLFRNNIYIKTTGGPFEWRIFRKYLCTGHNAALHNKLLYLKNGFYDESFKSAADYEFLLRSGSNLKTLYVDVVTTRMNLGGASNNNINVIKEAHLARKINKTNSNFIEFTIVLKGYFSFLLNKILK